MIGMSLSTPIQDVSVHQFPLDLVSQLLQEVSLQQCGMLLGGGVGGGLVQLSPHIYNRLLETRILCSVAFNFVMKVKPN